jgi:saccharopine dehydrogenase-like NADP-dependent oxidoreductase
MNTRKELLQRILSAVRSTNNTAALRKVTSSLVTQVIKYIQVDGGHFEQLALVLNGESVTVHLATYSVNTQCSSCLSNLVTAI